MITAVCAGVRYTKGMPWEIFESPDTVEGSVIQNDPNFLEVDRIEFDRGIRVYVKGHEYPQKGMPTPQAIWAVNVVKTLLRRGLLLFFLNRSAWKAIGKRAMKHYFIKYEFLTPTAQSTYDFLKVFLRDAGTAKLIAHIVEYDGAYRFRLMDMMSETDRYKMWKDPSGELRRLLILNRQRDYQVVSDKLAAVEPLLYMLYLPWIRNRFREALMYTDFFKLQFDKADAYWASMKTDYKYFGTL